MKKEISCLLLLACLVGAQPGLGESRPALYRVTNEKGGKIYLFGTMHVGREDLLPGGEALEAAWREADVLAVEADTLALQHDLLASLRYSAAMAYAPGDQAENHLSPEAFALGVEKLGQRGDRLNRLRPAAWVSLAEQKIYGAIGLSGDAGVEAALLKRAHEEGKKVKEIEGVEAQMELMRSIPDAVCSDTLARMLRDEQGTADATLRLTEAWAAGDEEAFSALYAQSMAEYPPELEAAYQAYYDLLYARRNQRFLKWIEENLSPDETVLFAVGAAHVLGDGALRDMLAAAGYGVERVQ